MWWTYCIYIQNIRGRQANDEHSKWAWRALRVAKGSATSQTHGLKSTGTLVHSLFLCSSVSVIAYRLSVGSTQSWLHCFYKHDDMTVQEARFSGEKFMRSACCALRDARDAAIRSLTRRSLSAFTRTTPTNAAVVFPLAHAQSLGNACGFRLPAPITRRMKNKFPD